MYKTDFYITVAAKRNQFNEPISYRFERVTGWGECLETLNGRLIEIRLNKVGRTWRASEESTGLYLGKDGATRTEVLNQLTPEFLEQVAKELDKEHNKKLANTLADYLLTH